MIKNKPKRDGSGQGTRKNAGRSGCTVTKKTGQGKRTPKTGNRRNK